MCECESDINYDGRKREREREEPAAHFVSECDTVIQGK